MIPTEPLRPILWIIGLVVLAFVLVFLFQGIVMPLIRTIT
jgi:hypothetical protein